VKEKNPCPSSYATVNLFFTMSVQRNPSVLRDDWMPDWLRGANPVPAPRQDEAVEALDAPPDPSMSQLRGEGRPVTQPSRAELDGSGDCVHVQSAEGAPLGSPGRGGVGIQPPPPAHGMYPDDGFIPIEPAAGYRLDDLTGQGDVEIQPPEDGDNNTTVDPERDRSVK
jgi:hypothetical protein